MKPGVRAILHHSLLLTAILTLMVNPLAALAAPIPQSPPADLLPAAGVTADPPPHEIFLPFTLTAVLNASPSPGQPPAAPVGFKGEPASTTSLRLSWTDNAGNESGYRIERLGSSGYTLLANLQANTTSYVDEGLAPGTTYQYRLRSFNSSGACAWVETSAKTPETTLPPPAAPTGFKGEAVSATSLRLTWTDNAGNESGYQIERLDNSDYVLLTNLPADTTSYVDQGLLPGTTYQYRLRSVNSGGESAWVETSAQTGAPPTSPPAAPTPCGVRNITETTAEFYWTDNSNNEEYFGIYIFQPPGDFRLLGEMDADATYVNITDLPPDSQFQMRVIATNSAGTASCTTNSVRTQPPASQSLVRFQNNASYPIVSLIVDGLEYFPASPWGILPGSYYEIPLQPGAHDYHLSTGHWQSQTSRFLMYSYWDPFTVLSKQTTTITIEDISIENLLTQFDQSGYWEGSFWDASNNCHTAAFQFRQDGSYTFYVGGKSQATGQYSLVERMPAVYGVKFRVAPGDDYVGLLIETHGQFTMKNGPPNWKQITYNYKPQGYQYNPFCP
jgi:hypothetical protein